ncbi:hypothetical protein EV363DRAFT_1074124, partial [Boletus edulis]
RVQPPPQERSNVTMDKNALRELRKDRHNKTEQFQNDLSAAWKSVDETVQALATKHHKSVRYVENGLHFGHMKFSTKREKINPWNAFCWELGRQHREAQAHGPTENAPGPGKAALPTFVKENHAQYLALSAEEKAKLVESFADHRVTKAVGTRISTQSKIRDISQTLNAVESEARFHSTYLNNLKSRTGVEAILYATRGTTNLPLQGLAFATEGVLDFMGSVMKVDNPDFISKMEGFAVQGVKGAAHNHATRVANIRGTIREIITTKLREITGDPAARMHWSYYFRNVVSRHQVIIEGWPESIPFANLSNACSSMTHLETLLRNWEDGTTHWKTLTDTEFEKLRQKRNEQLGEGEIEEPTRRTRSDKGTKRRR